MHDDGSMRELAQRLVTCTPAHREELQKLHSKYAVPESVLLDAGLNYAGVSATFFDWMHNWCIDGVFARTFKDTMDHLKAQAKGMRQNFHPTIADLDAYMHKWVWPRQFVGGHRIFESGNIDGGNAGQVLAAVKVIRRFFLEVAAPVVRAAHAPRSCIDAIGVLERACDIVIDLRNASLGYGSAATLKMKTFAFCNMFLSVFGGDASRWVLKFHISMHMCMQWRALQAEVPDCILPNCFVLERKHKSVKKHMKLRLSGQSWERGVMEEMFLDQIAALQEGGLTGLVAPHAPMTSAEKCDLELVGQDGIVAVEWRSPCNGARYLRGDVVVATGNCVGQARRFVSATDMEAHVLLEVWEELSCGEHSGTYRVHADRLVARPCAALRQACIFSREGVQRTVIW